MTASDTRGGRGVQILSGRACFCCVDLSSAAHTPTRTHTPLLSLWPESFCFPVLNPERLDPQISDRIVGIIARIESSMWPPYCSVLLLWRCRACCQHPATSQGFSFFFFFFMLCVVNNRLEWEIGGRLSAAQALLKWKGSLVWPDSKQSNRWFLSKLSKEPKDGYASASGHANRKLPNTSDVQLRTID